MKTKVVHEIEDLEMPDARPREFVLNGGVIDQYVSGISYRLDYRVEFIFDGTPIPPPLFAARGDSSLLFDEVSERIELIATKLSLSSGSGTVVRAAPVVEPIVFNLLHGYPERFEGYFSALPEGLLPGRVLEFKSGDITVNIQRYAISRKHHGYGSGRLDGCFEVTGAKNLESAEAMMRNVSQFLMLVRGTRVGYGHIGGFDAAGKLIQRVIGFRKSDIDEPEFGWFCYGLHGELPSLFDSWSHASGDKALRPVLYRAVYFYRSANISRQDSTELAIISSYAALETLVAYILEEQAKWSQSLVSSAKFSDRLRATFGFCGFEADPFGSLEKLLNFASDSNKIDAFEVLARIRNDIVHPKKRTDADGHIYMEAWAMSQWMVEVLVFFLLRYRGKMQDRRVFGGWAGTTVDVPVYR